MTAAFFFNSERGKTGLRWIRRPLTGLLSSCSVSLIECGPVNTDFLANLQKAEVEDVCEKLDQQTLGLYEKYLQHCNSVFQNSAQDTEDIVKVCGQGQHGFANGTLMESFGAFGRGIFRHSNSANAFWETSPHIIQLPVICE